jgi:hypothetical protein
LSFASLLLAAGGASAAEPSAVLTDAGPAAEVAPAAQAQLVGRWTITQTGRELRVALEVENAGDETAHVQVARGPFPGAFLTGDVLEGLTRLSSAEEDRVEMSRMGPLPIWGAIDPGQRRSVGVWRYTLPGRRSLGPVSLQATVLTMQGSVVLEGSAVLQVPSA